MADRNQISPTDGKKIRLLTDCSHGKPGDVLTVSPGVADRLIAANNAELFSE